MSPHATSTLLVSLRVAAFATLAVLPPGALLGLLMARTARVAFEGVDPRLEAMAGTLGSAPARVLLEVTLPPARRGLLAGAVLGFSRRLRSSGRR